MPIETWKKAFYPIPAYSNELDDDEKRILHSIKKWTGLLPKNRKKHNVHLYGDRLFTVKKGQVDKIEIDGDTCSLCQYYYNIDGNSPEETCKACPLSQYVTYCDNDLYSEALENPQLMINALTTTLEAIRRNERPIP